MFDRTARRSDDAPPTDPAFLGQSVRVIGSAAISLEAAARLCESWFGIPAMIRSDAIEGKAREVATWSRPFSASVLLLSGGETTVTVTGLCGQGGRNTKSALSLAIDIERAGNIHTLSADTDGFDGGNEAAGGFVDGGTAMRLRYTEIDPRRPWPGMHRARHSSGSAHCASAARRAPTSMISGRF